jgi:hypothetical protein
MRLGLIAILRFNPNRVGYVIDLQQNLSIGLGKTTKCSKRSARGIAVAALDQGRWWGAFRIVNRDSQSVAIYADDFKI